MEISSEREFTRAGKNFLGILNDLKRRPEDAAKELGVSEEEIRLIIDGKKALSSEIITKAQKIWPVKASDFYIIHDDCPTGVKIISAEESEKSSRVMERAGKPYYEYRDTAMSSVAPFRPEWILELCYVNDNDPENQVVQWNNGHFMHQFTYFIGEVNFYYLDDEGRKKVAIMKTGDSMYITPFVPHTFTTRNNAQKNGLILAITYGEKLTGEVKQELSVLSTNLGSQFFLDFSTKENASASLLKFHRQISSLTIDEVSRRTKISVDTLLNLENGSLLPSDKEIKLLAAAFNVNTRELLPNEKVEKKVIIKSYEECKRWYYPESSKIYEFIELASTTSLPFSKAFEIIVQNTIDDQGWMTVGLHQYIYNIGDNELFLNWELEGKKYNKLIKPNDSAYIKPFVRHGFYGKGKLLALRISGKIPGDSQRELSTLGNKNAIRAINETMVWFNPSGKQ